MSSSEPPRSSSSPLIFFAVALTAGQALFLLFLPLNSHVPAVLTVLSLLCGGLGGLVFLLRRSSNGTGTFGRDAGIVLWAALVMRALVFFAPPTLSDDVFRYLWDGRVQNAGIDPYTYAPSAGELATLHDETFPSINHPTVHTVYPPLAELTFRAAAAVRPSIQLQKIFSIAFDLAAVVMLLLLLRDRGKAAAWAALYAWHPLPVLEFASSGHIDSLMIFLLLTGCWLYGRGRKGRAAGVFGLAVLAKWIPLVMAPWLALRGRLRDTAIFIAVIALFLLPFASGLVASALSLRHGASVGVGGVHDWVFNAGLYAALAPLIVNPWLRKIVLGAALISFSVWWARRNEDPVHYAFGVLLALLLASPAVHPWYLTWLLPLAVLVGSVPAFLWAWLVAFSYVVQIRYANGGGWNLPGWVPAVEYGIVYPALAATLVAALRRPYHPRATYPPLPVPKIGVVIPALNEEKAIGLVIADIPRANVRQIVVVDNGSADRTAAVAEEAGARVVHERRRGYGAAVQRGLVALADDVDVVVILDGDRSDFAEELPRLIDPIQRGEADFVLGSRVEAAERGSLMPQQRFGNWLTCILIRALTGFRYTDMGPFRAIRRTALDDMRMVDRSFGWNVEMQIKALLNGLRVLEEPVRYRPRIGQSKISGTVRGTFRAGTSILAAVYRYGVAR